MPELILARFFFLGGCFLGISGEAAELLEVLLGAGGGGEEMVQANSDAVLTIYIYV